MLFPMKPFTPLSTVHQARLRSFILYYKNGDATGYPRIKRRRRKTAIEEEKIRIDQRTETINQREIFGHGKEI